VHALKYQGRTDVAGFLARRAASMGAIRANTVLVPVPLHARRERARGYNQSELLARALAETAPGVAVAMALVRERPTRSQTRLDREARAANVARAFALAASSEVRGRDVLLIDDVVTTGATLLAAAFALGPAEPATVAAMVAAAEM
jgi:ComF family protein